MAEKEITFELGFDTKNIKRDVQDLNKELNAMFKVTGDKDLSAKVETLTNRLEKQQNTLTKTLDKIKEYGSATIPTDAFKELEKEAEKTALKLERLRAERQALVADKNAPRREFRIDLKVDQMVAAENKLRELRVEMEQLKASGKDAVIDPKAQEQADRLSEKVRFLVNDMQTGIKRVYEADGAIAEGVRNSEDLAKAQQNAGESAQWLAENTKYSAEEGVNLQTAVSGVAMAMSTFVARMQEVSQMGGWAGALAKGFLAVHSAVKKTFELLKKVANAVKEVTKLVASKLVSAIKKAVRHMAQLNKSSSQHNTSMKGIVNTMLKYGLGIRSVFILWRKLRAYAADALKLMAQQFEEVDKDVSNIINSFNQFKNSVGTLVQPLMHTFAPAIETILGLLTQANEALANFFAIFTGQKYIYKAKKSNESYAESLKKVSGKAEDANKELAQYDKLLVIKSNNDNGGGSGSGDADETVDAFEKTIAQSEFAKQLRAAIDNDDWEGVGALFAEKLNTITDNLHTWITGTFNPMIKKWALNISDTINGFFQTYHWDELGKTIGDGMNGIFTAIKTFWTNLDGLLVGQSLGSLVANWFTTVDWNTVVTSFTSKWNTMIEIVHGFVQELLKIDIGGTLGNAINAGLEDFDAAELGQTLSDVAHLILSTLTNLIETVNWFELGQKVIEMIANINWSQLFSDAAELLGAALGAVGSLILGLITDGLEAAYDYFAQQIKDSGGNIIQGVLAGIAEALVNIWQWIKDNIFKPFIDGFKKAFGISSPSKEMEPMGNFIVEGLKQGISNAVQGVIDLFVELKNKIVQVVEGIKNKVTGIFSTLGGILKGAVKKIKEWLVSGFTSAAKSITSVFKKLKETIDDIFTKIKNGIKKVVNGIISIIEGMVNGIIKGINFMIDALNKLQIDIPEVEIAGLELGGGTIGFDIPNIDLVEIPRLAQGAVIPANNEFLALLGDQKHGTNIEAPLETIEQALRNVLSEMGSVQHDDINLNIDGKTVAKVVWDENQKRYKQTGMRFA